MNNPVDYTLFWKVIKYKNQKGISQWFDSWRGKKNEFKSGYIDQITTSPIHPQYRYTRAFVKYKVIGRLQIQNLHIDYEEYKEDNK